MSEDSENPFLALILLPFRLLLALGDLIVALWLLMLFAGLTALIGAFLWLLITGP